jgi:ElaB/YqjD/DUF883 family membrane-anchored ribosome-binding protein
MEADTTTMMGSNEAQKDVGRTVDKLAGNAHRAIDKAADGARPKVDQMAAGAHNLVDKLAGAANNAADSFDEKSAQMKDAQARVTEGCRDYVREHPFTSLGIAVAAGFLLARLLSSR